MKQDRVMQIGGYIIAKNRDNPNNGRVYSILGISPCLNSAMGMGGNLVPAITEKYETI